MHSLGSRTQLLKRGMTLFFSEKDYGEWALVGLLVSNSCACRCLERKRLLTLRTLLDARLYEYNLAAPS